MSATDPTRPVRDQTADDDETALRKDLWRELFAARDERDALRATVDRVRALTATPSGYVTTHAIIAALDGATQAASRPPCQTCGAAGMAGMNHAHAAPAAQGVPLTEDPRAGQVACWPPYESEDPQR